MPTAKQFGTVSLKADGDDLTGDWVNTVNGTQAKIKCKFYSDMDGSYHGTLTYNGEPAQSFTGRFVALTGGYLVYCSLDFKDDPTKKYIVPITMTLDKK